MFCSINYTHNCFVIFTMPIKTLLLASYVCNMLDIFYVYLGSRIWTKQVYYKRKVRTWQLKLIPIFFWKPWLQFTNPIARFLLFYFSILFLLWCLIDKVYVLRRIVLCLLELIKLNESDSSPSAICGNCGLLFLFFKLFIMISSYARVISNPLMLSFTSFKFDPNKKKELVCSEAENSRTFSQRKRKENY